MTSYRPARTLFNLKGSGTTTTLTASGTSGAIDIGDSLCLWLAVTVAGTVTGTSPTLDVQIDLQDVDGNWYAQAAKITQLTAAGAGHVSVGLDMNGAAAITLPRTVRVTWTIGGTATPTFPQTSISLTGR
ncbi:hypothetical protein KCMC57_63890 (plasmid) [Kitasatospora sp. CMC57]|uniref:Uncharacterized protein n=1 Tax=Kitasatospora sp. CMC57 TaxID=3231513 RepID=A0AB33K801_9ACTN